ncbi:MAG: M20/M25/M40 family metallo-hydrolase, partial [Acidiferrobacterales bacterium]
WTSDPFRLVARDGNLYGRGTSDNKAGAATLVANLIRMKQEGIVPERDLVVVLTLDEESNMQSIRWLLEHHEPLLEAEFALNTDAGDVLAINGKATTFSIQAAEKVYMTLELRADNPGGHSSLPQPENAIYSLAKALNKISEFQFPVNLNDVTRANFARPGESVATNMKSAMRRLASDEAGPQDLALLQSDPSMNAQMRTTCVATQLSGGHAENALPTFAIAVINCRILPQENAEEVEFKLKQVIADDTISMRRTYEPVASPPSPLVPEVLGLVTRIAGDMFPGIKIAPAMGAGATDGLYTRSNGIPTYGFSGIASSSEGNRDHGIDERIKQSAFIDSVEFWYRIMLAL